MVCFVHKDKTCIVDMLSPMTTMFTSINVVNVYTFLLPKPAWVGRSVASVCLSVCALAGIWPELYSACQYAAVLLVDTTAYVL